MSAACQTCGHGERQHAARKWECYDCIRYDSVPQCTDYVARAAAVARRETKD